ncbi:hypothetical protein [Sphingobium chlorophenolicum]|uniref:hypothetical protein n=1 Tax=Sphingobium chlorophenolicum TaxID=46429 RepID=UPI00142ED216|nr:hypothetical protein [Sphingobium chlorophenolicum]
MKPGLIVQCHCPDSGRAAPAPLDIGIDSPIRREGRAPEGKSAADQQIRAGALGKCLIRKFFNSSNILRFVV